MACFVPKNIFPESVYNFQKMNSIKEPVKFISVGKTHGLVVTEESATKPSKIYGWGSNMYFQIGQVLPMENFAPTSMKLSAENKKVLAG